MKTRRNGLPLLWLPLTVLSVLVLLAGCSLTAQSSNPAWVDQLIHTFRGEPVGNPPQSIWRYEYKGQVVYFIPAQCCDQFSQLYDLDGNLVCSPDGGFIGMGDGRCSDFFSHRANESLVWQDPRSR